MDGRANGVVAHPSLWRCERLWTRQPPTGRRAVNHHQERESPGL